MLRIDRLSFTLASSSNKTKSQTPSKVADVYKTLTWGGKKTMNQQMTVLKNESIYPCSKMKNFCHLQNMQGERTSKPIIILRILSHVTNGMSAVEQFLRRSR